MIRLRILLAGLTLMSFISAQGVNAGEAIAMVYTLDECIKEAMTNNWSIKVRNEKIEEVEYKKKQAKADFLPKFSTSYGYTRLGEVQRSTATAFSPARDLNTQDNYQWKGTVSQTLFSGFALMSAYELAKLGIDQSKIDLELAKLDLALRVKEAYFNILKAEKSLDVAKKAVESLESHVKMNRNFYDVGMIPINDLLKTEVELSNAQYTLIIAQNASQMAQAALNTLLAWPINKPVLVEDILVYKSDKPDFNEYMTKALDNRPEIKALDISVNQTDEQIRLAKSKYYPSAVLTYDYIKAGDDPNVSGSDFHDDSSWQATAALSWTIWEWGKANDSIREKKSLKRQLVQTRKNLEDNIRLELKKAILDLDKAEKNIPTAKKAVEQAEENLRVSQERYKAQVTTFTEVLDAQTLLSQARTNYYNALYDHNLAKAGLLRAIGKY